MRQLAAQRAREVSYANLRSGSSRARERESARVGDASTLYFSPPPKLVSLLIAQPTMAARTGNGTR